MNDELNEQMCQMYKNGTITFALVALRDVVDQDYVAQTTD